MHFNYTTSDIERFWSKIKLTANDDLCWLWQGSTGTKEYGQFHVGSRRNSHKVGAHIVAFELSKGNIPKGLYVLHSCDNPKCCNPKHLFLGTQLDNMKDMLSKGRGGKRGGQRGTDNGCSKLTEKDVLNIRELCSKGVSQHQLSREYGVHVMTINNIIHYKIWEWLKPETAKGQKEGAQITFQTGGEAHHEATFNAQGQRAATFKKTPKTPTSQGLEGIDNDTTDQRG